MRVVLSDTSPLHYLILIGEAEVLPRLYGRILIPSSVAAELDHPRTPATIRAWIAKPPDWITIVPATADTGAISADLDAGERDAIALALDLKADLVLMDDRDGVQEATRLGLTVVGTIGVLDRAADKGFVNLPAALFSLRATNFRASDDLYDHLLAEDSRRRKNP